MAQERFSERVRGDVPYPLRHIPISDIREGLRIAQCFLVKQKTKRSTRTGDPYLEILLADRTGTLPARAWSEATERYASEFEEGEFVFVQGRAETYRNSLQLIVESIRRLEAYERDSGKLPGFDPALLVPASSHDIDEMWKAVQGLVASIEPEPLRRLTGSILEENEGAFKEYPAAIEYHHAYVGGLLEHTLEVARGVKRFAEDFPEIDLGLAVAGAILHDIGKIREFDNPIAPHHTFSGQLIGHLLLGRDMVREAARKVDWPDEKLPELLEHIIVSHHGELEFGSAILPKTPEAICVYHFDNLSAKLNMIRLHIERDSETGDFTDWHRLLGRKFFKGRLTDA